MLRKFDCNQTKMLCNFCKTKFKHLMTLKIKDNIFYILLYNEKNTFTRVCLWTTNPDPEPVFYRIRIRVTQKDRIRIRNTAYNHFLVVKSEVSKYYVINTVKLLKVF